MNFDLKRPCKQCPFRTDVPGYLTKGRVDELKGALVAQDGVFSCHKTVDYSDDDGYDDCDVPQPRVPSADEQHCAGALILLEKLEQPNQMMRIAERLGFYDREQLDMAAPVFDTFAQMKRHMPR